MEVDQPETVKNGTESGTAPKHESELVAGKRIANTLLQTLSFSAIKPSDEDEEFDEFPIYKSQGLNKFKWKNQIIKENGSDGMPGVAQRAPPNVWEDNLDDEVVETEFHK